MPKYIARLNPFNLLKVNFHAGGWLSVILVFLATILLAMNLLRVVTNARDNLDVLASEKISLRDLQKLNEDLHNDLDYYLSYEYKKLYARDNLRLVEPGERLFRIIPKSQSYEVVRKEIEFFADSNYLDWWQELL